MRFLLIEPLLEDLGDDLADMSRAIVGGESGRGARPMSPDWVRSIRAACRHNTTSQSDQAPVDRGAPCHDRPD